MKLVTFAIEDGELVETKKLTPKDVAVFVTSVNDKNVVYTWHGPKSSTNDQNAVKKIMIPFLEKYDSFEFIRVSEPPPSDVAMAINTLMGKPIY